MPVMLGVNHRLLTWFGNTSRLPASWGIQKLWITSAEVSEKLAVWPTGRCISLNVTMLYGFRYLNSHHHWWAVTLIWTELEGAASAVLKIVSTVGTATTVRTITGRSVQVI